MTQTEEIKIYDYVWTSPDMRVALDQIDKVAASEIPALIVGEKGTEKKFIAKAIHNLSHKKDGPFEMMNCGPIPIEILDTELLGCEKEAFTGGYGSKKGFIENTNGGSLFINDIDRIPVEIAKCLGGLLRRKIYCSSWRERPDQPGYKNNWRNRTEANQY